MMKLLIFMFLLNFLLPFVEDSIIMFVFMNSIFMMGFLFLISFNYNNMWMSIYSWFGVDNYSLILMLLTIWIIGSMFMASMKFKNLKWYVFILLMLLMFLMISFMSMNYFMFYLFFEMSLIPTFILIMGWGYQPERIGASMYMLLYTLFASLPLLILLFYVYNSFFSLNYVIMMNSFLNLSLNNLITYIYMIFAFLVKLPLFMFHIWLPKAHIEAPVTGSMILAAVMLKLGGYGLMRSFMFMLNLSKCLNFIFFGISLFGMIYLSLMSLRCNDFKLIVAYSSVVHMMMMLMGLLTLMMLGFKGGFLMMIGHGLCSSALFLLVNFLYDRTKSRNMILNKGMINFFPSMSMWWFMFCVINMSAPISLNLLSEILILMILFNWSSKIIFLLMLGMYFSAIYSLYLFSYIQHGEFLMNIIKMNNSNIIEFLMMLIHWIPLNLMILKMDWFF